jgi:hypothetical protein
MTVAETRKIVVAGLRAQDYRMVLDGPSGEYFGPSGHTDQGVIWVGWPFEGRALKVEPLDLITSRNS